MPSVDLKTQAQPAKLGEEMNLAEFRRLMGHEDIKTTMESLHPDTSGWLPL